MVDIQAKLKEIGPFVEGPDDNLLVCRCEEVTKGRSEKQYTKVFLHWKRCADISVPEWDYVRDRPAEN